MNIKEIYETFPTKKDCIDFLEFCLWEDNPKCPYCDSTKHSKIKNENRYHCNWCYSSYSVTVKTVFHKTRCDLQKWLYIMYVMLKMNQSLKIRETSKSLKISANTLSLIIYKIRIESLRNKIELDKILKHL